MDHIFYLRRSSSFKYYFLPDILFMNRCPGCKAVIKNQTECYRCGLVFKNILNCEGLALKYYQGALSKTQQNKYPEALEDIQRSCFYSCTPDSRKLRALLLLQTLY